MFTSACLFSLVCMRMSSTCIPAECWWMTFLSAFAFLLIWRVCAVWERLCELRLSILTACCVLEMTLKFQLRAERFSSLSLVTEERVGWAELWSSAWKWRDRGEETAGSYSCYLARRSESYPFATKNGARPWNLITSFSNSPCFHWLGRTD